MKIFYVLVLFFHLQLGCSAPKASLMMHAYDGTPRYHYQSLDNLVGESKKPFTQKYQELQLEVVAICEQRKKIKAALRTLNPTLGAHALEQLTDRTLAEKIEHAYEQRLADGAKTSYSPGQQFQLRMNHQIALQMVQNSKKISTNWCCCL